MANGESYAGLPLFEQAGVVKPKRTRVQNSGYITDEDLALSREVTANGYDLDRPARVYSVSQGGKVTNLWKMSTRDAMRVCSHPKSRGQHYQHWWMYCWTQHDVEGAQNKVKASFKDDGRLKHFKGLEDIKILGVY